MLRQIFYILLLTFTLAIFAEEPQTPPQLSKEEIIKQWMQKNNIPGVAVVLYQGGKLQQYYFGYADREKKIPVTNDSVFEVGSLTKLFTSLLLAQQVDAAKVQLNDSITKSLTDLPAQFEDISFLNLATHTSGLPFNLPKNIDTPEKMYTYLKDLALPNKTDEDYQYSNVGMGLLGYALEATTHLNFSQMYNKYIFKPLRMSHTFLVTPVRQKKLLAHGYDANGNAVANENEGLFPTAYALKTNASDMQKFLHAAIGFNEQPETIFYPMRMTQADYIDLHDKSMGLGWQIHQLDHEDADVNDDDVVSINETPKFYGDRLFDKTGSTSGFNAYIAVLPNKKSGVVILTNRARTKEIVNIGRELLGL